MPIEYERKSKIGYFTIRNGSVNPMTPAMHKQLYGHMLEFLADDNVHVGIMQGAGDRAFSAGDDIKTPYAKFDTPMAELEYYLAPKHRMETKEPDTFSWSRDVLALALREGLPAKQIDSAALDRLRRACDSGRTKGAAAEIVATLAGAGLDAEEGVVQGWIDATAAGGCDRHRSEVPGKPAIPAFR